jgi:hypothetical protein
MTGTNGVGGGHGETNGHNSSPEKGSWTIGLINSRYRMLRPNASIRWNADPDPDPAFQVNPDPDPGFLLTGERELDH